MEILDKLGINGKIFLAQVVNFFLLMYVLKRFLYGPLLNVIKKREEKIKEGLKNAAQAEKDLAEAEGKALQKIEKASVEADLILEKARLESEENRKKSLDKAKEEIDRFKEETKIYLSREKAKILGEVKKESGDLLIGLVEKLLDRKISNEEREKWSREVKTELEKEI